MHPLDLIASARSSIGNPAGGPTQASLRRATSTAYYAIFHCLALHGADLLIGRFKPGKNDRAWLQVYRSLDHGHCRNQCQKSSVVGSFPKPIQDFADVFVSLQAKRHAADYDPCQQFQELDVQADIDLAEQCIRLFEAQKATDRRAFCAWVMFKVPRQG